jgi:hypothetical protein
MMHMALTRSFAVYLLGSIPDEDHDRSCKLDIKLIDSVKLSFRRAAMQEPEIE